MTEREEAERVRLYRPMDVNIMKTSYVELENLEEADACIFKGNFYDKDQKKVGMVIPLDTFFKLHNNTECQRVFDKVGLDGYFKLPPWGIDVQRSYELMTAIDEDGHAEITDKDGVKVQVHITEEIMSEALKLPTPVQAQRFPYQLT